MGNLSEVSDQQLVEGGPPLHHRMVLPVAVFLHELGEALGDLIRGGKIPSFHRFEGLPQDLRLLLVQTGQSLASGKGDSQPIVFARFQSPGLTAMPFARLDHQSGSGSQNVGILLHPPVYLSIDNVVQFEFLGVLIRFQCVIEGPGEANQPKMLNSGSKRSSSSKVAGCLPGSGLKSSHASRCLRTLIFLPFMFFLNPVNQKYEFQRL